MSTKQELIAMLDGEYNRWETLLEGITEEQALQPQLPAGLSVKDVMAHLWAWQQRTIARMEAALGGYPPRFPQWGEGLDPDQEEHLEAINAWILAAYRPKSWPNVYTDWQAGFQRVIDLARQVPEEDLLEPGKYDWLAAYPLSFILEATYDHHHEEHLQPLLAWLRTSGKRSLAG